ncbi:hypothetical protein V1514DRAFT_330421 [Lipomyces japonicus]|uniref:uncharacterized protein n=1 Tax=Lipomyces japonicus TaxID=56871 RepID=UPI0034CE75BC
MNLSVYRLKIINKMISEILNIIICGDPSDLKEKTTKIMSTLKNIIDQLHGDTFTGQSIMPLIMRQVNCLYNLINTVLQAERDAEIITIILHLRTKHKIGRVLSHASVQPVQHANKPPPRTILWKWLNDHMYNPYPSEFEKRHLRDLTGYSKVQLDNWFRNARRRRILTKVQ